MKLLLLSFIFVFISVGCSSQKEEDLKTTKLDIELDSNTVSKEEDGISRAERIVDSLRQIYKPIPDSLIENHLEDEVRVLKIGPLACTFCPTWVEDDGYNESHYLERGLFLEPVDTNNILTIDKLYTEDTIPDNVYPYAEVKGRFYKEKRYPNNYQWRSYAPYPARVLRYTEWTIKYEKHQKKRIEKK